MQLGVRAHDFNPCPLPQLIEKLGRHGFPAIQLALHKSFPESVPALSALSPGSASYYGNAFRQAGIQIAVLGCYVNIIDPDPARRAQALHDFSTHLRLARDFGASLVGTETGSTSRGYTPDNFTEEAFQQVVASVKQMTAEAERFGVTVGIEAGINHPLYTAQLTRRLLDEVSSHNLQVIFDAANLMTPENYLDQDRIVAEALELLGDRIAVLHLKDFTIIDGRLHIVPAGQGLLNFTPLLHYMKYKRPHIHGLLESTPEEHMQESARLLRRIYSEL
ncbi:sugar phosphate isomerase/epimerase [Paenibacillus sp. MMS20-IR301]|uniref:sugar phosphate isomerase/epimerase family protein n=1 Tax=Paenibacillus sp. MMS20-IR301 TaxID=2895946 RepID=UPI0028E6D2D7|nr:sugar phosphate isomerase/epimerase [Paenibacillus sp. MMS20-IR301]WNS44246.1 sugar phosphate isomerase/epimerase [Paenibacillus sp. MMS20-IR301]